jgi:hypothetical protein
MVDGGVDVLSSRILVCPGDLDRASVKSQDGLAHTALRGGLHRLNSCRARSASVLAIQPITVAGLAPESSTARYWLACDPGAEGE